MTVVLIGVGVDSSNSGPHPQIYNNGRFEYIPIPEAHQTAEENTYGSIAREHSGGNLTPASESESTLADALKYIKPEEDTGKKYTGEDLESHPLHHDPNFSELPMER